MHGLLVGGAGAVAVLVLVEERGAAAFAGAARGGGAAGVGAAVAVGALVRAGLLVVGFRGGRGLLRAGGDGAGAGRASGVRASEGDDAGGLWGNWVCAVGD